MVKVGGRVSEGTFMKEIGLKEELKVKESINGLMARFMKVVLRTV